MSTNERTIVFSRFWNPHQVELCLKQARSRCPGFRIVHIFENAGSPGDVGWPDSYDAGGEFEATMAFLKERDEIWGPNDFMFQKASVSRWNVLRTWMRKEGLEWVFHCDSDVLWFTPPDMTPHLTWGTPMFSFNGENKIHAGHCFVNLELLDKMWARIIDYMADPGTTPNTVQDMAAWSDVVHTAGVPYSNTNRELGGVIWDHHMGDCKGFESVNGYKTVYWKGRRPFFKTEDGRLLETPVLHCWGDAENHMADYINDGGGFL